MERKHGDRARRRSLVVLVVGAAIAAAACSAGSTVPPASAHAEPSGSVPGTTASVPATASPTGEPPAPAASSSPLVSGPATVTGTHSCSEVIAGTDTPVGDVFQRRGQVFRCSWDTSDPRMRGTGISLISADIADIVNDAPAVIWADDVTWNEAGTWVGRATGTKDAAGAHHLSTISLGTGAYAGLRYTDSESGPGDTWPLDGRIEPIPTASSAPATGAPAGASASAGSGTCHEVLAGTTVAPGMVRGWVLECDVTSADRRVGGRQLVLVDADVQPDGTERLWGVTVVWNEQGTWDGSWTGSAARGWPTSQWTWNATLIGADAYRGLGYRVHTSTPNGVGVDTTGSITAGGD